MPIEPVRILANIPDAGGSLRRKVWNGLKISKVETQKPAASPAGTNIPGDANTNGGGMHAGPSALNRKASIAASSPSAGHAEKS